MHIQCISPDTMPVCLVESEFQANKVTPTAPQFYANSNVISTQPRAQIIIAPKPADA